MQILEHENDGTIARDRAEHRVQRRHVAFDGLDFEDRQPCLHFGLELDREQLAEVCVRIGPCLTEQIAQRLLERGTRLGLVGRGPDTDQRSHEVDDEVIGQGLTVRKAPSLEPPRFRIGSGNLGAKLTEEAGLPDARLAENARDAALSGARDREELAQARELVVSPDHRRTDATEAARAHRAGLESGNGEGLHRVGLALELEVANIARVDKRGEEAMRRGGDEDAAGLGVRLHARGDVHRVAHRGVLVRLLGPDDADHHGTGVDPHADPQIGDRLRAMLRAEVVDRPHHVEPATDRALRIILVRDRRAEESEHAVAHESRDGPAIALDRAVHETKGLAHDGRPVLRVQPLGDRGGIRDVGKEDGDLPSLAGSGRTALRLQVHGTSSSAYANPDSVSIARPRS